MTGAHMWTDVRLPARPASNEEIARLREGSPMAFDICDCLVSAGIATPEQGRAFIDTACAVARKREREQHEHRARRRWWQT